jgi:predicted Zn-ribbon and HTH transcriptional regulator
MIGKKLKIKEEIKNLRDRIKYLKDEIKKLDSDGSGWNYCKFCGHGWKQRKEKKSERCPACSKPGWENGETKKQSYDLGSIKIGDSKTIPWILLPDGKMDQRKNYRIARAVDSYSCRTKRRFRKEPDYTGLKITRIA